MLKELGAAEIKRLFECVPSAVNKDKRTGPGIHEEPLATGCVRLGPERDELGIDLWSFEFLCETGSEDTSQSLI